MSKILWKPSEKSIKKTNMAGLYERVFKTKIKSPGQFIYQSLHDWSIKNIEDFWSLVWDEANIIGDKGSQIISEYDDLIKSKFFPKGRLNFSENLLAGENNREVIVFYDERKKRISLTLNELKQKTIALAKWLIKNGIKSGDRVAVLGTNSPESIIAMLATASLGAIFTSCSPDFGEEGIIDRFGQCQPKIFITTDGYILSLIHI